MGAEKQIMSQPMKSLLILVNAIVAIEDHRFFNHRRGQTSFGSAVPSLHNLRGGSQGGSTPAQQLIKLTYFSTSLTVPSLVRSEAWLAATRKKATKQKSWPITSIKYLRRMGTTECRQLRKVITEKDLRSLNHSIGTPCGMLSANQYDVLHPEAALTAPKLKPLKEMLEDHF